MHNTESLPEGWDYNDDYNYPGDAVYNEDLTTMPEDLAREVHTAYATFKQACGRLSSAVKARGYYVRPPEGQGQEQGQERRPASSQRHVARRAQSTVGVQRLWRLRPLGRR